MLTTGRDGNPAATGHGSPALEIAGLRKTFGDTVAVDDVDLTVGRGSFFGLVGPNSADKTTALSMAVGLLRPDGGRSRVVAAGTLEEVRSGRSLEETFVDLVGIPAGGEEGLS